MREAGNTTHLMRAATGCGSVGIDAGEHLRSGRSTATGGQRTQGEHERMRWGRMLRSSRGPEERLNMLGEVLAASNRR